jgi:hypothetical protein
MFINVGFSPFSQIFLDNNVLSYYIFFNILCIDCDEIFQQYADIFYGFWDKPIIEDPLFL